MSSTPEPGAYPRADRSTGEDLAFTDRWGESTERSRKRRVAAAMKRRRHFRSRGAVMSAVAVLAVSGAGAGVAGAQSGAASTYLTAGSSGSQVSAVEEALGVPADGYFDAHLSKAVRGFQSENGLAVDGVVGPETAGALGLASAPSEPAARADAAGSGSSGSSSASGNATLEQIAQCESGGDPTAVSSDGQYRGKYQFSRETWAALGGSGDPAAAPESVQDEMAAQLLAQSGTSSWPSCG